MRKQTEEQKNGQAQVSEKICKKKKKKKKHFVCLYFTNVIRETKTTYIWLENRHDTIKHDTTPRQLLWQ